MMFFYKFNLYTNKKYRPVSEEDILETIEVYTYAT